MKTKPRDHSLLSTCCSSHFLNTAHMTPLFISVLLAAMCLECRGQKDNVLQPQGQRTVTEGDTVTLDCLYNSSLNNPNLYWYKQDGNNRPTFILSRVSRDEGNTADEFKERFLSTLDSKSKSVPLKIQKLHLSDSAVYYCALQTQSGASKLVFGAGAKLQVENNEEYEPSYYKVTDNNRTHACLATGFSRHNATKKHPSISGIFEKQPAVRISDDSLYNQVAILSSVNDTCVPDGMEKGECTDGLTPDPKVNLVTMTILGLRLLFIKTVVFNVLITLRLWISQ